MSQGLQHQPQEAPVPMVVALCASAGGLPAFHAFFDAMPSNSGISFVVLQHLPADHDSVLPDLIQRHTEIPVSAIDDDTDIQPDHVYVLPAGYHVVIEANHLHLKSMEGQEGTLRTIDRFLDSLAEAHRENAVAVILSGTGNDGLEGTRNIRERDGLVIAQTPDSSRQAGMPTSVISEGLADVVLDPSDMPATLMHYFNISLPDKDETNIGDTLDEIDLDKILQEVYQHTEHDFSGYKHSTLKRQIARRMGILQIKSPSAYVDYLQTQSQEVSILVKSLLIHVTSCFRDPEAFEVLKTHAILPLMRQLDKDTIFRVWVPGCATGEEAISIAILIYECQLELGLEKMEVRIFATDLSDTAIKHARRGVYSQSQLLEVSSSRLSKHFIEKNEGFEVRSHIHRMIIWSEHNLIEHPPFSKLHLISCRNVLIYFQKRLQDRIVTLFEFALVPDGILFLGSSETLPFENDTFKMLDRRLKIYQRTKNVQPSWLRLDQPLFTKTPRYRENFETMTPNRKQSDETEEIKIIKEALFEQYQGTYLIVDQSYHIRYSHGEVDRYLSIQPGRNGDHNILQMARNGLKIPLTIALQNVFESGTMIVRKDVWVKTNGLERIVNLTAKLISNNTDDDNTEGSRRCLIILELVEEGQNLKEFFPDTEDDKALATIESLREDLTETQKALESATEELHTKNEELTSSVEEVRSANEEVQTTNEELRTSKEELESMNEELNTLNSQLSDQNYELNHANDTLHNFLQSTEIGMIFLDQNLLIRAYTTAVTDIFSLRNSDAGRPLPDISNQLRYDNFEADVNSVLDTLVTVEQEVTTQDDRWYKMFIRPYRTTKNIIDGLVVTFSDITPQKRAQAQAEQQRNYAQYIVDTINNSLVELDEDLRVINANQTFYNQFHVIPDDTIGRLLYDLGNGQWDIPELRELLSEILSTRNIVRGYEVVHKFPGIGQRKMTLNARQIAELNRILLVITDITDDGS